MDKLKQLNHSEWLVMEQLWQAPHSLMELVTLLEASAGWSKSTVATMVRRMEEKDIIRHEEQGRTKIFYPCLSQAEVAQRETQSLLERAYHGSIGLLVSTMAQRNALTKEDIDDLYDILKKAEEDVK